MKKRKTEMEILKERGYITSKSKNGEAEVTHYIMDEDLVQFAISDPAQKLVDYATTKELAESLLHDNSAHIAMLNTVQRKVLFLVREAYLQGFNNGVAAHRAESYARTLRSTFGALYTDQTIVDFYNYLPLMRDTFRSSFCMEAQKDADGGLFQP